MNDNLPTKIDLYKLKLLHDIIFPIMKNLTCTKLNAQTSRKNIYIHHISPHHLIVTTAATINATFLPLEWRLSNWRCNRNATISGSARVCKKMMVVWWLFPKAEANGYSYGYQNQNTNNRREYCLGLHFVALKIVNSKLPLIFLYFIATLG